MSTRIPPPTTHLVLADDHPLYLQALSAALQRLRPGLLMSKATNYVELFELLSRYRDEVDLVLMDLNMPGSSGYGGLIYVRKAFPELPLIVISARDDLATRNRCLQAGAAAFLSKSADPEQITHMVSAILDGRYHFEAPPTQGGDDLQQRLAQLTDAQLRVLNLLALGHSNKIIARELDIAERTVKVHVSAILAKLGVDNRTQAALILRGDDDSL